MKMTRNNMKMPVKLFDYFVCIDNICTLIIYYFCHKEKDILNCPNLKISQCQTALEREKQRKYIEQINKSKVKFCVIEAYDKKKLTCMYTYMCMYIKSTMVKVVSLEIASSIEIKSIISYFLGAGWRI